MAGVPREDSDQLADAQADLSLRWAHSHFVGFVVRRLICYIVDWAIKLKSEKQTWADWK